jgi:hypothetical protein
MLTAIGNILHNLFMDTCKAQTQAMRPYEEIERLADEARATIRAYGLHVTATPTSDGVVLDDGMVRLSGFKSFYSLRLALQSWPQ